MRPHRLIWCAAFALLIAGCGGLQIDMDYNPQADFSTIRTYAWAQRTPSGDDDPRVYNALVAGRIKSAVDGVLQAKGLRLVSSSPDVQVAWHGAIEGKMIYETISDDYIYGWDAYGYPYGRGRPAMVIGTTRSRTTAREWDEGTLIIDIIEGSGEDLIWRSVGQAKLSQATRTPEEALARFNEVVMEMLADFPPAVPVTVALNAIRRSCPERPVVEVRVGGDQCRSVRGELSSTRPAPVRPRSNGPNLIRRTI